jgi:hypothetical protein
MFINLKHAALTLAAVMGISFFAGYKVAPREILDNTVEHVGFLTVDTKRVLSATVDSLKSESHLVSYSYVGNQSVSINRSFWYLFKGDQQLNVPATVSYFVDLAKLNDSNATFDESTNTVTVVLPKLMLTVDFDPRRATMINSGMLTLKDSVVQALTKLNYNTARKSAIKQGQQAEFVRLAKERTRENIVRLFKVPLQVAGSAGVKIVVRFPDEAT